MKAPLLYLLLASSLACCTVPKKYLEYTESGNQVESEKFSKILIVGTGQSGSKLFLESLSEQLNNRLNSKNIQISHFHLGSNLTEANRQFRHLIQINEYDAVLQFAQVDSSKNPIFVTTGTGAAPAGPGVFAIEYSYVDIRYEQRFLVKFFDFKDLSKSLVDINIGVRLDFINPGDYSGLVDRLVNTLKMN
jgi:hypothetical protein